MSYPKVAIVILNWNGWKDTLECLESVYQITYPNYDVIVVDNGSKDESVEKIRECAYHIMRDEIEPYLKASDIVVYPYVEIFTTSALQLAFAFKKPVIATNVGCFPEDVGDAGILVPPKNPKTLAQAIKKLINNKKLQKELAEKGYERAKTIFSWKKIANEYFNMYEYLIER